MKGRQRRNFGRYYNLKYCPKPTLYMLYLLAICSLLLPTKWILSQDVSLSEIIYVLGTYALFYPYLKWVQFYTLDKKDYNEKIGNGYGNCADICFVLLLMIYSWGMLLDIYERDYTHFVYLLGVWLLGLLIFRLERCLMKKLFNAMDRKYGDRIHIL